MKQLLFLLLFPCLAMAQYPGNANQKITLGEQTTADGLVYRGVENDTALITPLSDTSAYIILDTVNNKFYNYNRTTNVWSVAGGGVSVSSFSAGTTGLTPSTATTGAVTLDGTLAVANGGTGSSTKNFVDLTTTQTIAGLKTFTNNTVFNGNLDIGSNVQSGANINGVYLDTKTQSAVTRDLIGYNVRMLGLQPPSGTYTIANMYNLKTTAPVVQENVTVTNSYGAYISRTDDGASGGVVTNKYALVTEDAAGNVGLGITNPSQRLVIKGRMIMFGGNDAVFFSSNGTLEDKWHFGVEGSAPNSIFSINQSGIAVRLRIINDGDVLMGYTTDQGAFKLQVNGQIFATNATIATSDEKFKENITPLNKGLEIVNKLKPVTFNFISDTENNFSEYEEVGFIAQDVDRALSSETFSKSIVKAADDSEPTSTMGLATQNLIPILVKAIQEQQVLIKALEQRILTLENK